MPAKDPSRIIVHQPRASAWAPAGGESHGPQIVDHIERHIGKVDSVFHELVSDTVHIDVHIVRPTEQRPWITLVTSGMSDLRMTAPAEMPDCGFAELILELPPDWPLAQADLADEDNYWPIRILKMLARFPHEYQTWLWYGHTIPNGGRDPRPYAGNNRFQGVMLTFPYTLPREFFRFTVQDGKTIHFWSLWPLYREEMDYKIKHGAEALEKRLAARNIKPVIDIQRVNACRRFLGLF